MHNNNHDSKMMWLMMAGCLLLPLALLFFGGRGTDGVSWSWFALIGAFILIHVLMMFGHRGHKEDGEDRDGTKPKQVTGTVKDSHRHN